MNNTKYIEEIKKRSKFKFIKGLIPRYRSFLKNSYFVWLARKNGAIIGENVTIPYKLAKRANSNLRIGNHTSIQTDRIDVRCKVEIGNYVMIGFDVEIITLSHNIDSPDWEHKAYGITIEDYCWLATRVFILPSCRLISYGAVCAAGSVVARNVESMAIISGNPAQILRKRLFVHSDLCVESMLGNDFIAYKNAYFLK